MDNKVTVHGFLKIGKEEHIDLLQKRGVIYCNTVEYFRTLEEKEKGRKDIREGAKSSLKAHDLKLFLDKDRKQEIPITITKAHLHTHDPDDLKTHLYCLYVIRSEHVTGKPFIDSRNIKFGDKALLITDTQEFLNRFKKGAGESIDYSNGFVRYYDEDKDHSNLTIYHKPDFFLYQSEYRFHIKNKSDRALQFEIGSIEDISIKFDADMLPKVHLGESENSALQHFV
jgi:hypothetical protein